MNRWLGSKALIVASTAGMVYGVYLMAGRGWAVLVGSFAVYVAGYHMASANAAAEARGAHKERERLVTSILEAQRERMN